MDEHEQEALERDSTIAKMLIEIIRHDTSASLGPQSIDLDVQERDRRAMLQLARRANLLLSMSHEPSIQKEDSKTDKADQKIPGDTVHDHILKELSAHILESAGRAGRPDDTRRLPQARSNSEQPASRLKEILHRWISSRVPGLEEKLQSIAKLHLDPNARRGQKTKLWLSAARDLEKLNIPKKDISRALKPLIDESIRNFAIRDPEILYSGRMDDEASSRRRPKGTVRPFNSGYFSRTMAKAGYVDQERQERGRNKRPRPGKDDPDVRLRAGLRMRLARIYDHLKGLESDGAGSKEQEIFYMRQLARALRLRMAMIDRRRSGVPYLDHIRAMNRSEAGERGTESWYRYITWSGLQDRFIEDPSRLSELKQLPIFEPGCRDEAIVCGHYGMQCPGCEGWRVKKAHDHKVRCTACQHTFEAQIETRCRYCDRPIVEDEAECTNGLLCPGCGTLTEISASGDYILRFTDRQLRKDRAV